jgi:L-rhamnose mutarotase
VPERIAFRMNLFPGRVAEYKKRHDEIFPDLLATLRQVGISDYSIWFDPEDHHLFAILTRADDHAMAELPRREVMQRWWKFMGDVMATNEDGSPVQIPLRQVFYMA